MKRVFRIRDKFKGFLEVYRLKYNNRRKNDLIWLHWRDYLGKNENGITINKDETRWIIQGLKETLKVEKDNKKKKAKNKNVKYTRRMFKKPRIYIINPIEKSK